MQRVGPKVPPITGTGSIDQRSQTDPCSRAANRP